MRRLKIQSVASGVNVALWLALLAIAAPPARAAPLDETVCQSLDAEQKQLELQGLEDDLAKGVDWGKTNLPAARLELVKHYIAVKEQVLFRCPSLLAVSVPELAEPEARHPIAEPAPKSSTKRKREAVAVPLPTRKPAATD